MADPRKLAEAVLLPGFAGTTAPDWVRRRLAEGLGGVILFGRNVVDDEQVAALTAELRSARDGVVVGIDEEGGDVTRLDVGKGSFMPGPLALAAAGDPGLTSSVAAVLGERLAACGVTVNLAPCADLAIAAEDPGNGVRAFGSDPVAASAHVTAFVDGMQKYGVAACVKHFPGHGAATEDSHFSLPVLPRTAAELREVELVPFGAAIQGGVRTVMSGHLVVPEWGEEPATFNRTALVDVLRGELGFTGTVITDALEMGAVSGAYGRHDGLGEASVRALLAGADALCLGGAAFDAETLDRVAEAIVAAVANGRLSLERLADAAERTAALGTSPSPAQLRPVDYTLGLSAARKALRITGTPKLAGPPLVVDVQTDPGIAAGPMPWGLGTHLTELVPGSRTLSVSPGDAASVLAEASSAASVVVVTREAHRHPAVREFLGQLSTVDYIRVETGYPGPETGDVQRVDTFSGSYVSLRAAAEYLAGA
ncbi:glycoside hydrolase family 3 protein [Amycolatopsis silviterrae]